MATREWSNAYELVPAGSDAGSTLDEVIKNLKVDIRERAHQGGIVFKSSTTAEDGLACRANADNNSTSWALYQADKSTKMIDPSDDDTLDVDADIVLAGAHVITGGNVTTGNNPGHGHDVTVGLPLPISATGRIVGPIYHNDGNGNIELQGARLVSFGTPASTAVVIQMDQVASGYSNPNTATGTDVFANPNEPTLAVAARTTAQFTTIANSTLEPGEAWLFDCDAFDSGATDLWIFLEIRRV
jgi:hypothetical protein